MSPRLFSDAYGRFMGQLNGLNRIHRKVTERLFFGHSLVSGIRRPQRQAACNLLAWLLPSSPRPRGLGIEY
jgi:hypothetical protein